MEANKITVIDEAGKEIQMEVLFTFNSEVNGKNYVLYFNPQAEEMSVFASVYTEDGQLFEVETPEEWEMIEEVFQSFVADQEGSGSGCGCGHDSHGCCGDHSEEEHNCCGGNDGCGC